MKTLEERLSDIEKILAAEKDEYAVGLDIETLKRENAALAMQVHVASAEIRDLNRKLGEALKYKPAAEAMATQLNNERALRYSADERVDKLIEEAHNRDAIMDSLRARQADV